MTNHQLRQILCKPSPYRRMVRAFRNLCASFAYRMLSR